MKKAFLLLPIVLASFFFSSCEKQEDDNYVENLTIRSYTADKTPTALVKVTFIAFANGVSKYTWSYSNPDETQKVVFDTINGYKVVATFDSISEDYTIHCKAEGDVDSKSVDLKDIWNVKKKKTEVDYITYGNYYKKGVYKGIKFAPNTMFSISYLWDFGDGVTSTKEKPLHKYKVITDTTYNVTCSVRGTLDTLNVGTKVVFE